MGWRSCVMVILLLTLCGAELGADDGNMPRVNIGSGKTPAYSPGKSSKDERLAPEIFRYERMKFLHPVQKQVICRLAGDENMRFAHSVLVKSIVEQFKVLPALQIGEKEVAEGIALLENHWQLIQRVPGTESQHDPLFELIDDPNARFGLKLWAKHVCSPDNIMCEQG